MSNTTSPTPGSPFQTPGLPIWTIPLVGLLVALIVIWATGLFKPSAPSASSGGGTPATTGAIPQPAPPSIPTTPAPASAGITSDKFYTLKPGEWVRVETGGKKFMLNWNTPDKKLRMRWEFWNGKVDEREFEYGKPQDMGTDPCDLNFYHPQGGSVRVTLQ